MVSEAVVNKNIPVCTAQTGILVAIRRAVDLGGPSGNLGPGAGGREARCDVERHLGPIPGFQVTSRGGLLEGQEEQASERTRRQNGPQDHPDGVHQGRAVPP